MDSEYLTVELHCHTIHSMDGLMTFESLCRTAEKVGIDALAITDHDTLTGALEFARRIEDVGARRLQIIPGEERTLDDGSHLIGLFLQRAIRSQVLGEVIREIEGQGGLCLIPHPFRRKDGLLRHGLQPLDSFAGRVAGFELFSAKSSFAENQKAAELLERTDLGPFGGSDAHYECDLGEALNLLRRDGESDLRTHLQRMFERKAPVQIQGKPQADQDGERRYAPAYHRWKKYLPLPKACKPLAKQCYRHYRNFRHGIGRKPLREVYRHA